MDTIEEVLSFIEDEDVRFIRLVFFDGYGIQKNISILPDLLPKALKEGIPIDPSSLSGLVHEDGKTLYLKPDLSTAIVLPWRSIEGSVIAFISELYYGDGSEYPYDPRKMLKKAVQEAIDQDLFFNMATQFEFYLFLMDEMGNNTKRPLDFGGYMDVAPKDKGENVRRDICLTIEEMGLQPQASYHQAGPGQNEIDFHSSSPLQAADEAVIFKWVVKMMADSNGLFADFSPKPIEECPGNGLHIQWTFPKRESKERIGHFIAGLLEHIDALTLFLNPIQTSYARLGKQKAPAQIGWSYTHRHSLIHLNEKKKNRFELRSPDPLCNPYLCFSLLIRAGMDGIKRNLSLGKPLDQIKEADWIKHLPATKQEAYQKASQDEWIKEWIPQTMIDLYK